MTDASRDSAPRECELPGCSVVVEQVDDGGPPRRYCSPAHRAAARKLRHSARMATTGAGDGDTEPQRPPAPLAAPVAPTPPPPAVAEEWSPAASWSVAPVSLPPTDRTGATPRKIVLRPVKRAKAARPGHERRKVAALLRQRAVASIAVASLIAGGTGYILTESAAPAAPPQPPPPRVDPQPTTLEADQWADRAEVVLASINKQLDAAAQAEATWRGLPEEVRNQAPPAVRALLDRKVLLEQQRATLMSQLDALRSLPEITTDLATAQAQLDDVERALNATPPAPGAPEQAATVETLTEQREMRRQQRDHKTQELTDLRNGVEEALRTPLPDDGDRTTPLVQQVLALMQHGPDRDSGGNPAPRASGREAPAPDVPRRSGSAQERRDVAVTAPPNPHRSTLAAVLDGGREDGGRDHGRADERLGGPVQQVATTAADTVGRVLGAPARAAAQNDDERPGRGGDQSHGDDRHSAGNDDAPLTRTVSRVSRAATDTVHGVLGGSRNDDDRRDARNDDHRDDHGDDHGGNRAEDHRTAGNDHGPLTRTVSRVSRAATDTVDGVLGGSGHASDRGADRRSSARADERRPTGKSGRARNGAGAGGSASAERAGEQRDTGRPVGKAERQRQLRDVAQRVGSVIRGGSDATEGHERGRRDDTRGGTDRTGGDRSSADRSSADRSSADRSSADRSSADRKGSGDRTDSGPGRPAGERENDRGGNDGGRTARSRGDSSRGGADRAGERSGDGQRAQHGDRGSGRDTSRSHDGGTSRAGSKGDGDRGGDRASRTSGRSADHGSGRDSARRGDRGNRGGDSDHGKGGGKKGSGGKGSGSSSGNRGDG